MHLNSKKSMFCYMWLPKNSVKKAMHMACFNDKLLEETEVAKEFATSLAPIP